MTAQPEERVALVCSYCGSDNILIDAYARWNIETQELEVAQTFDKGSHCNRCDGPCCVNEVSLDNPVIIE